MIFFLVGSLTVCVYNYHVFFAGVRGDGEGGKGDPRLQLVGVACDASRTKRDDECGTGNKVSSFEQNIYFEVYIYERTKMKNREKDRAI